MRSIPPVLTVAGSDNSAGAGIQADLKTMSALGVYGLTAVTCVVAEVPGRVSAIQAVAPQIVAQQVRLSFEAFPVAALKTGMLYSAEIVAAVAQELELQRNRAELPPLVVDPVMVATSGDRLLEAAAVDAYRQQLFPIATLVTPNLDEAAALLGSAITTRSQMRDAAHELLRHFGCAWLIKGGHLREDVAADLLVQPSGVEEWFEAPFIRGVSTHGTGCTYAAAVASELGKGRSLSAAVGAAKQFVSGSVAGCLRWRTESGETDALHHFHPR